MGIGILELLFGWWIVTLLGIAAIIIAEPLWTSRRPKDGRSIDLDEADRGVGRRDRNLISRGVRALDASRP